MSQENIAGATSGDYIQLDNVILDVYSKEIYFKAQPNLRFESIAVHRSELGAMPGNKIKFLRYNSLGGSSQLVETVPIITDVLSSATIEITVSEQGKAVSMSEFLMRSAITDVLSDAATLLGMHYAKSRDAMIRDALMGNTNVLYAKDKATRADLDADDVFNVDLVREIVENMATQKAPKFNGDAYIGFIHPRQARFLRKDGAWVNVNLYASPENILNGEIGRIEDVRFIETTMVPLVKKNTQQIWADNEDTGKTTVVAANADTDVYRAVFVGDNAVGMAESLPVEMRDNGVEDFGRKHSLAYYGIWGAGLIETGHSFIAETA
jgi:N4-gp56 family major capsid protein